MVEPLNESQASSKDLQLCPGTHCTADQRHETQVNNTLVITLQSSTSLTRHWWSLKVRVRNFTRKCLLRSVYREGGHYLLFLQAPFQTFSIRSRCAKRRLATEYTTCACASKLPLILSSLRVLPCSGSPRALETARECVRDWDTAQDGGKEKRRGREVSHNLFVYSTKWGKVYCWAEKGWHGMIFFS